MSFMDRIAECRAGGADRFAPFWVGPSELGRVDRAFAAALRGFPDVFAVGAGGVRLAASLDGYGARTAAVAEVLETLRRGGLIPGWRGEPYPVGPAFNAPALFEMERAAVPLFGVRGYGVHMNGWLRKGGRTFMWIARRSPDKPTGPGKLDQMVAGGQPAGLSLRDNLIKECGEEAGVPAALARRARSAGTVSYRTVRAEGLRNDVLFVFDLEVPAGFRPVNRDGEVAEFMLWDIGEVMRRLRDTEDFKFNSALVIIDFLVRRGFIDADDPDYPDIVAGLRR